MSLRKLAPLVVCLLSAATQAQDRYFFFQADRVEYVEHDNSWLWDMQGWYGSDEHKVWWKSEGEFDSDATEEAELQLLYSKPVSAFWDFQLGLRHDFEATSNSHIVVGVQGLAPQWFEVDLAAFVDENGDATVRLEAEYDLLLTQRLILQPRVEFDTGPESAALELRLRYEIRREIAPYIGISWQNESGESSFTSLVAGARFWF